MNTSVVIETLASCMIIPLFVLGALAFYAVLSFIFEHKILRR